MDLAMKNLLVCAAVCLFSMPAYAGGSIDTSEVLGILKKNKVLYAFVTSTLDLGPGGSAVRLGRHFDEVGGMRIAPYVIPAKRKGDKDFNMELVVTCEQKFVDRDGKELDIGDGSPSEVTKAVEDVIEKVVSVSQREPVE